MKNQFTVDELKGEFDQVLLRHSKGESDRGGQSVAALVKGDEAFVGVSLCHTNDQFNRTLGRQIALGRAYHAYAVSLGDAAARSRLESLSYVANVKGLTGDEILERIKYVR